MLGNRKPDTDSSPPDSGRAGMSDPSAMLDMVMSRRGGSPVLVGRAAEMGTLQSAVEAVRLGEPAAVLIRRGTRGGKNPPDRRITAGARGCRGPGPSPAWPAT